MLPGDDSQIICDNFFPILLGIFIMHFSQFISIPNYCMCYISIGGDQMASAEVRGINYYCHQILQVEQHVPPTSHLLVETLGSCTLTGTCLHIYHSSLGHLLHTLNISPKS